MEVGDSSQKEHKMQQIDMCRTRINEIKNEYDARINALQAEMRALEQEIRDMDIEKSHIKNVIETFQKELEIA
jgi:prefoldin subunit 5